MYKPVIPVLWTEVDRWGTTSVLDYLHSNGTYLRQRSGRIVGTGGFKKEKILFISQYEEDEIRGWISDKILVARIKRYWNECLGSHRTNCSTFAHYLTTGEFTECEERYDSLVIKQGMRPYEMASRIDIGDMVCILYAKDRIGRSRANPVGGRYRKTRRRRRIQSRFDVVEDMKLQKKPWTAKKIRAVWMHSWMKDFHFMVCVAKHDGEPVWLSQAGFADRSDPVHFAITWGRNDCYLENTPVFAFIKKRR